MKYAVVERERRFRISRLPDGVRETTEVVDRYVIGTRLRLREVRAGDGTIVRKLGHKVRITDDATEVACTNFYLDDEEWAVLLTLPARVLRKRRHLVEREGLRIAVDEHDDGTLIAEIDDGDHPSDVVPAWLDVIEDVTLDENWTGAALAAGRTSSRR